jgi:proliferating cell nuclear antigen
MKVVHSDAQKFGKFFEAIGKITDEAAINFTKDGIVVKALDPSRVVFADLLIPASEFETYEVDAEETAGVRLDYFTKILKRAKKGNSLELSLDGNMFKITIKGKTGKKTFSTGIIDAEAPDISLPELDYSVNAIVDAKELLEGLKDVSLASDAVRFVATEDTFRIEGSGTTQEVSIEPEATYEGTGKASYGISYLIDILKPIKNGDIEIRFGDDMPIEIKYAEGDARLIFLVAPRVED